MTAATTDGESKGIGRAERIGTITLVKGAVARLRRRGWYALGVWAGIFGAGWALQAAALVSGINTATPLVAGIPAGQLVLLVLTGAVSGLGAALALRLIIEGPRRLLRMDRRLLECAGLMAGMSLAFSVSQLIYATAARDQAPGVVAISAILFLIAYLGGVYALLKLTLLPICRMTGRTDISLGTSWRLMRKATRGLVLGYVVFMIPFGVVIAGNWGTLSTGAEPTGLAQGIFLAVGAAYAMACYAMAATIYQLRVENPATVADVFD